MMRIVTRCTVCFEYARMEARRLLNTPATARVRNIGVAESQVLRLFLEHTSRAGSSPG